jgi:hypothetical protein
VRITIGGQRFTPSRRSLLEGDGPGSRKARHVTGRNGNIEARDERTFLRLKGQLARLEVGAELLEAGRIPVRQASTSSRRPMSARALL